MMEVAIIGPHSAKWMREKVLDDYINGQHRVRQESMEEFFKMEDVYSIRLILIMKKIHTN
jgi:hypothetical protein